MVKEQEKPFIHLLRSPNSGYFYDANQNEIIAVSDDLYTALWEWVNHDELPKDSAVLEEISIFQTQGLLLPVMVKKVEHPYTEVLPVMLERNIQKITLQLTQDCNFRCKYCAYSQTNEANRSHSHKKMSEDIAKKGIRFLRDHSIDCANVYVGFYGGEPLLEFEMIKRLVLYSEEILEGKEIIFNITTNGTLLNRDVIEFFSAHNVDLLLSLDGPKEINDKNRIFANGKGTFDSVIEKLCFVENKFPEFLEKMSINMVIDPSEDYQKVLGLFDEYPVLNKMRVSSSLIDDTFNDIKNSYNECYTMPAEYNYFLANLCYLGLLDGDKLTPLMKSAVSSIAGQQDRWSQSSLGTESAPGGPCITGTSRLFLDVNGNFLPCERVSETSASMDIGNVDCGINLDKALSLLNIAQLTTNECMKCWAFRKCTLCARFADDGKQLSGKEKTQHCEESRWRALQQIRDTILFQEANNNYLSFHNGRK